MKLFKFTIKSKLISLYTVIFAILLTLVGYGTVIVFERMFVSRLDTYLIAYSQIFQEKIPKYLMEGNFKSGELPRANESELRSLKKAVHLPQRTVFSFSDVQLQLVDGKGKFLIGDQHLEKARRYRKSKVVSPERMSFLLLDSGEKTFRMYRKRLFPSLKRFPKKFSKKLSELFGLDKMPDEVILEVAISMEGFDEIKDHIIHGQLILVTIALLIAGLASYFIARYGFKPVTRMAKTAGIISATNLDQRLELPKEEDEVHMLGKTMNAMIERIQKAFKLQQQFIADASHEIQTPLTIIMAELELSLKKIKDQEAREGIEISLSELENLSKLSKSLLTLARLDTKEDDLRFKSVRLDELLMESIQNLQGLAKQKQIKLEIFIMESIEIQAESEKLRKAIINIIENAIKYSKVGKKISVHLKKLEKQVLIEIKDSGVGISDKALPYVFNRFYRAPEHRGEIIGNGLGLAIVKQIIELHKGKISIDSKSGVGTTVRMSFPL